MSSKDDYVAVQDLLTITELDEESQGMIAVWVCCLMIRSATTGMELLVEVGWRG